MKRGYPIHRPSPAFVRCVTFGLLMLWGLCLLPGLLANTSPAEPYSTTDPSPAIVVYAERDIRVGDYFSWVDSLARHYEGRLSYPIHEHLLLQRNRWLIDSLAHTDYYYRLERGEFVYDQPGLVVIPRGSALVIPGAEEADSLQRWLGGLLLDINIPEFTLRILQGDSVLHAFPVRVGQNATRYLAMAGRRLNLRTRTGQGSIVRIERDPAYINPVNNHRYHSTLRDDGQRTRLPRIPWLETEINGIRNGQMIHPTTNPETLGRAYSNGCIGTGEAAAWVIYAHAPLGTAVHIRYDLHPPGDSLPLPDIYGSPSIRREQ